MAKIKEVSSYNGTSWDTPVPIGANDVNIDITSSTTNPTDTIATSAGLVDSDVTVVAGDTDATAWTKFNRFRKRVQNAFGNFAGVTLKTAYNTSNTSTSIYTTGVLNNYMSNVIGYTGTTAPSVGTVAAQLSALNGAINEETAERKTYTKPNLLDNWYFAGGGSQAGAGKFPINQRGQTSYSTLNSLSIDRWMLRQGTLSFPNTNDCIKFTRIEQHIDDGLFDVVIGKNVTFSILTVNGNLYSYTATASSNNWMAITPLGYSFVGWGHTIQITDSNAVGVVAVKLELGDTQTLAHQVNGAWVLNEIPNYQEELVKCIGSHADSSDTYANCDYAKATQYHKGDTFNIINGATLMAVVGSSGTSGGATVTLPKEIGSDVTSFTWAGSFNFFAEVNHPDGIAGLTITGIQKTASNALSIAFSFPSGTTVIKRTLGFINSLNITITFN